MCNLQFFLYHLWKLSPTVMAQAMATTLLRWAPNAPTTLLKGGGVNDDTAVVQVQNTDPGGGRINVMLARLEGNIGNGIWLVTRVETSGITINAPTDQASVRTPVTIEGRSTVLMERSHQ